MATFGHDFSETREIPVEHCAECAMIRFSERSKAQTMLLNHILFLTKKLRVGLACILKVLSHVDSSFLCDSPCKQSEDV